jgi:hypothetical protein
MESRRGNMRIPIRFSYIARQKQNGELRTSHSYLSGNNRFRSAGWIKHGFFCFVSRYWNDIAAKFLKNMKGHLTVLTNVSHGWRLITLSENRHWQIFAGNSIWNGVQEFICQRKPADAHEIPQLSLVLLSVFVMPLVLDQPIYPTWAPSGSRRSPDAINSVVPYGSWWNCVAFWIRCCAHLNPSRE